MRAATRSRLTIEALSTVSIRTAREGGDTSLKPVSLSQAVSIRTAREGGDQSGARHEYAGEVSIRTAREGGDLSNVPPNKPDYVFQSAPPVRAATSCV